MSSDEAKSDKIKTILNGIMDQAFPEIALEKSVRLLATEVHALCSILVGKDVITIAEMDAMREKVNVMAVSLKDQFDAEQRNGEAQSSTPT